MYPIDLLTLPGTFLRRTRVWYARGRTWRQTPARPATAPAVPRGDRAIASRLPIARAG